MIRPFETIVFQLFLDMFRASGAGLNQQQIEKLRAASLQFAETFKAEAKLACLEHMKEFQTNVKEAIAELVRNGFIPRLHCDGDWTPLLSYFLELPKRSCILELEPMTSMKKAKEILGGHMCLYGDVGPDLLALGTPDEVDEYCRKKIEEVGKDGFILANEDIMPINAKYENVKALVEAGKKYGTSARYEKAKALVGAGKRYGAS